MADNKVSTKERIKRVIPWIIGGVTTVGGAVVAYKIGKSFAETEDQLEKDDVVNDFLKNRVHDVQDGIPYVIDIMDANGKETFAELRLCDKPTWWEENGVEVSGESTFDEMVTSAIPRAE